MPFFSYKVYDKDGHVEESELEAENIAEARSKLQQRGMLVTYVKPIADSGVIKFPWRKDSVTLNDLEFITSELSILLNSGVKIDKGLKIVAKNRKSGGLANLVNEILKNLKMGKGVAESFDTKDKVFDSLYLNLIAIGEKSGKLPQVFEGLANDLKFKKELKAKVTQALTYPAVILFVCIACLVFVFNYIVPQMASIFAEGDDIPVYTALLINTSNWMLKYQLWLVALAAIVGAYLYHKRNDPALKSLIAKRAFALPVLSNLIKQTECIRFNSAMSLMLTAGVKVDVAIASATRNIKNAIIRKSLEIANEKIKKGGAISTSLGMTPLYPDFYVSLLEVGEESGELERIFDEIAVRSKTEFENWTNRVTNILEPLLILVMGGIVGSVVITMLLSVVSVNDISL
ncbi:type II secretion system F family protein [Planctobacterium marinum]|uniref:type II secretion system F family protein n=1 Tax=Planctobacterium marinum TaxID=1631968 RepID=UPI001E3CA14A|nr:type II secretion system F family protein [Planctobacterium marinum]MCC2606159.1 type II secretion system F family protein [Planctobacterium marinum]